MELDLAQRSIKECLELATRRGEHVLTNRHQRVIGKTTALIEFAKEHKYIVVVNDDAIANGLRFEFNYERIVGMNRIHVSNIIDGLNKEIVFDECCKPELIEQLVNQGFKVITGFIHDKHSEFGTNERHLNEPRVSIGSAPLPYGEAIGVGMNVDESLLTITLSDIDSKPVVYYKGKQIDRKLRVAFDWESQSINKINRTYIHIEHVPANNKRCNTEIIQHNQPIEVEYTYLK